MTRLNNQSADRRIQISLSEAQYQDIQRHAEAESRPVALMARILLIHGLRDFEIRTEREDTARAAAAALERRIIEALRAE